MRIGLVGLFMLLCPPVFAQQPGMPPVIRFDSAPDPLKLPPNLYFGEVTGVAVNSKGHVFVLSRGNTSGPGLCRRGGAAARSSTPTASSCARSARTSTPGRSRHTVKVDPHDNIWVTDKGSDMVIKFNPEGRVVMVFGRKQEASDEETGPLKHPKPPLPAEMAGSAR